MFTSKAPILLPCGGQSSRGRALANAICRTNLGKEWYIRILLQNQHGTMFPEMALKDERCTDVLL